MIDALHGSIVHIEPNSMIIRTSSMDFSCTVSTTASSYFASLPEQKKALVSILTFLYHREDSMMLYGFSDREERMMFLELIKVQGIGPKQAIKMLSGITAAEFAAALDSGDIDRLVQIPGLGKKTAQKLILALRNKIQFSTDIGTDLQGSGTKAVNHQRLCGEIVHALTEMGYDKRTAEQTVTEIYSAIGSSHIDERSLEEKIFKEALMRLA